MDERTLRACQKSRTQSASFIALPMCLHGAMGDGRSLTFAHAHSNQICLDERMEGHRRPNNSLMLTRLAGTKEVVPCPLSCPTMKRASPSRRAA